MTSGMDESPDDAELTKRVRDGDRTAVRALLERDHGVADLFARMAAFDGDPRGVVEHAWEQLLRDVVEGTVLGGLRAALLVRVAAALGTAEETPHPPRRPSLGTFTAAGDRWEGWWEDEPPG